MGERGVLRQGGTGGRKRRASVGGNDGRKRRASAGWYRWKEEAYFGRVVPVEGRGVLREGQHLIF